MEAGKLDRRVLIEYPVTTQDGAYGSPIITWTTLVTALARVRDIPSKESIVNNALRMAMRPCKVAIRYRSTITTAMRVTLIDEGRVMQIVSIAEVGRKIGLELFCENFSS